MAPFGLLWLIVLDPLSLLTRTVTTAGVPGFVWGFNSPETGLLHVGARQRSSTGSRRAYAPSSCPSYQPVYAQGSCLAFLFLGVVRSTPSPTSSGAGTCARWAPCSAC